MPPDPTPSPTDPRDRIAERQAMTQHTPERFADYPTVGSLVQLAFTQGSIWNGHRDYTVDEIADEVNRRHNNALANLNPEHLAAVLEAIRNAVDFLKTQPPECLGISRVDGHMYRDEMIQSLGGCLSALEGSKQ